MHLDSICSSISYTFFTAYSTAEIKQWQLRLNLVAALPLMSRVQITFRAWMQLSVLHYIEALQWTYPPYKVSCQHSGSPFSREIDSPTSSSQTLLNLYLLAITSVICDYKAPILHKHSKY
jgi:hypothetical protein